MDEMSADLDNNVEAQLSSITHRNYRGLVAAAHRRRVTAFGAPALARHLVFWNPIGRDKIEPDEKRETPFAINRRKSADAFVSAIYKNLREQEEYEIVTGVSLIPPPAETAQAAPVRSINEPLALFAGKMCPITGAVDTAAEGVQSDSYGAIKIYFDWQGIKTILSIELHVEFITLTAILDLSPKKDEISSLEKRAYTGRGPDGAIGPVPNTFALLTSRLSDIRRLYTMGAEEKELWEPLHRYVYYEIWEEFDK